MKIAIVSHNPSPTNEANGWKEGGKGDCVLLLMGPNTLQQLASELAQLDRVVAYVGRMPEVTVGQLGGIGLTSDRTTFVHCGCQAGSLETALEANGLSGARVVNCGECGGNRAMQRIYQDALHGILP